MQITLNHATPLHICSNSIRQCWQSQDKSDTEHELIPLIHAESGEDMSYSMTSCGPVDRALIDRIGNKFKHASTLEHLSYNFTIEGVSRALLQELSRHRMASLSVKSTRYTLAELKDESSFHLSDGCYDHNRGERYLVYTNDIDIDEMSIKALENLRILLRDGKSNDIAKYCLPESYKTSLSWTINARSLQNFLALRSSKAALWEIRDLAQAIFDSLPEDHKYLFEHCLSEEH